MILNVSTGNHGYGVKSAKLRKKRKNKKKQKTRKYPH